MANLSDLQDKFIWAQTHPEEAQAIAQRSAALVERMTMDHEANSLAAQLLQLRSLFRPTVLPDAALRPSGIVALQNENDYTKRSISTYEHRMIPLVLGSQKGSLDGKKRPPRAMREPHLHCPVQRGNNRDVCFWYC